MYVLQVGAANRRDDRLPAAPLFRSIVQFRVGQLLEIVNQGAVIHGAEAVVVQNLHHFQNLLR